MLQILSPEIIIPLLLIVILGILFSFLKSKHLSPKSSQPYHYTKKDSFMSRAEHQCYDALIQAVGHEYYIFAQVHLPTLLDFKHNGENNLAAKSHIDRKSVDFVLCDKNYIAPKLAIELDDSSHDRPDRQDRDMVVEDILKETGLPLLRLTNTGHFNPTALAQQIHSSIIPTA